MANGQSRPTPWAWSRRVRAYYGDREKRREIGKSGLVAEFQQRHDRKIDDRIKRRGRSFRIFGAVAMLFSR